MNRRLQRGAAMAAGLLLMVSIGFVSASPAAAHGAGLDGCTVVPDSGVFFDFHEDCDDHDRCYISQPYGSSSSARSQCDSDFYRDMLASCRSMWPRWTQFVPRGICYGIASTYYVGVRAFGGFFFERGTDTVIA